MRTFLTLACQICLVGSKFLQSFKSEQKKKSQGGGAGFWNIQNENFDFRAFFVDHLASKICPGGGSKFLHSSKNATKKTFSQGDGPKMKSSEWSETSRNAKISESWAFFVDQNYKMATKVCPGDQFCSHIDLDCKAVGLNWQFVALQKYRSIPLYEVYISAGPIMGQAGAHRGGTVRLKQEAVQKLWVRHFPPPITCILCP